MVARLSQVSRIFLITVDARDGAGRNCDPNCNLEGGKPKRYYRSVDI